ncbi:MAG: ABC transporter ATP-binding protein [Bacteriovoracaceae bacterium]|nr:ABC transporter ATP-binding protein [Bacteriovoracaceae bacterium]
MIELNNVSKSFVQGSKNINVLEKLNFELKDQGIIALTGRSGSGKSTFLSLVAGLDAPTQGEITIAGKKITNMSESELTEFRAKNIGIIFQSFHLIDHFTALENIMLPLEVLGEESPKDKALKALELVGLSDRASHFPKQLSGGEKQRVAIARAYVTNPNIILADEPSGNLDPDTGESVMKMLFETAKSLNQTVLLVTHDHDLAKQCDHIYEIKNHSIEKL